MGEQHQEDMEAAGLAIGILGAFNIILCDIQAFHAVKEYDISYENCTLQLAGVQIRFSRWGESLGLTTAKTEVNETMLDKLVPEGDRAHALRLLKHMQNLLEKAQKETDEIEEQTTADHHDSKLKRLGRPWARRGSSKPNTTDPDEEDLSERIRQFTISRKPSLARKAIWVLIHKPTFDELLVSINNFINDLEKLFPDTEEARKTLGKEEVRRFGAKEMERIMSAVKETKAAQDDVLSEALKAQDEARVAAAGVTNSLKFGDHNKGLQTGSIHGGTISWSNQ